MNIFKKINKWLDENIFVDEPTMKISEEIIEADLLRIENKGYDNKSYYKMSVHKIPSIIPSHYNDYNVDENFIVENVENETDKTITGWFKHAPTIEIISKDEALISQFMQYGNWHKECGYQRKENEL